MQEYKRILEGIIERNCLVIEEDGALSLLRCRGTFDYLQSIPADIHGWVNNELGLHGSGQNALQYFLKSHEQKNPFGSANYILRASDISNLAKIRLLTTLVDPDDDKGHNYFIYFCIGQQHKLLGNKDSSIRYLKQSAIEGFGYASHLLADQQDTLKEKYACLESAAFAKVPCDTSLYDLGHFKLVGEGCAKDVDGAFSCFEKCYQRYPQTTAGSMSLYELSLFYLHGRGTVRKDLEKAYTYLINAKKAGVRDAQTFCNGMYGELALIEELLQRDKANQEKIEALEKLVAFNKLDINSILNREVKSFLA